MCCKLTLTKAIWSVSLASFSISGAARSQVFVYEGDAFPEDVGWERVGTFDCDRSIEDGWFRQDCDLGVWGPEIGETDFYRRPFEAFAGAAEFFIEWRVETDVPSALFDVAGIATVVSAAGFSGVNYQFTVTEDRVRLIRDNRLPFVFVDIDPNTAHSYRLELEGADIYRWYVDGNLAASGVPEGTYPTSDSRLIWGARHDVYENTTRWDYLRYGVIPEPATAVLVFLGGLVVCSRRGGPR